MAKPKNGNDRKVGRMSCYTNRNPLSEQPPEVMSLDESETLLGSHYGSDNRFVSPSVTILELGGPTTTGTTTPCSLNNKQRIPSISSCAIPSPYTEQTTITSAGDFI